MKSDYHIRYLQHEEIDKSKWNDCVDNAANGLIYAYSHYLSCMAKNWDGLVLNDYEAIMPLPWNKKYGVYYLYQPAFTSSLGIFGKSLSEQLVEHFIQSIPKKFKLIEILLNQGNIFSGSKGFSMLRNNFVLELNVGYEALYKNYKENTRRNIKKAMQSGCTVRKHIPLADVITLSKPAMKKLTNIKDADYNNFDKLYHWLQKQDKAITYGVYSNTNELVASCVYFFSHNRAYYILVGNHPNGKTIGASHYLIDYFIKEHAGRDLVLDFEGSDIRNLAFFYSSFGATAEVYPFLKINNLPFWMKPFK